MKKILLTLLILSCAYMSHAQETPIGGKKSVVRVLGGIVEDSMFRLPKNYSITYPNFDSAGKLWYEPANLSPWFHNGTTRKRLASTTYVDSYVDAAMITTAYVYKATSVNCASAGTYSISTTLATRGRFTVTAINYIYKMFSGTVVTPPIISVGFTPATYIDNFGPSTLTSNPTVNVVTANTVSNRITVPASTLLVVNVSTAATFTTTGTYVIDVYVQGYYEN